MLVGQPPTISLQIRFTARSKSTSTRFPLFIHSGWVCILLPTICIQRDPLLCEAPWSANHLVRARYMCFRMHAALCVSVRCVCMCVFACVSPCVCVCVCGTANTVNGVILCAGILLCFWVGDMGGMVMAGNTVRGQSCDSHAIESGGCCCLFFHCPTSSSSPQDSLLASFHRNFLLPLFVALLRFAAVLCLASDYESDAFSGSLTDLLERDQT